MVIALTCQVRDEFVDFLCVTKSSFIILGCMFPSSATFYGKTLPSTYDVPTPTTVQYHPFLNGPRPRARNQRESVSILPSRTIMHSEN